MGRNILVSSVQNASFSILFQILFRCITFVLNAFIVRRVGAEVLGIINVRLLLLESTVLFLSKEPILKACLSKQSATSKWVYTVNQIWLSVPVSATFGLLFTLLWIHWLDVADTQWKEQYWRACVAIAISCIAEQVCQPPAIIMQHFCFIRIRVVLETIYVVVRTIIFVSLVVWRPQFTIDAFSIAQLVSVGVLCASYYGFFIWYTRALQIHRKELNVGGETFLFANMEDFRFNGITDLLPDWNVVPKIDGQLNQLCFSFAKQSVVKQMLTEGERYVMAMSPLLTLTEQSIYDLVNNLGSLAARFIFRPIEENAYFYFTQMLQRDISFDKQDNHKVAESERTFRYLCTTVVSIGLVIFTFGQSYSHTLLWLYGGDSLVASSLPITLLRVHCMAVVLLALNGITEAFVFATMSSAQLAKYNYVMALFSGMFLLIAYGLTSLLGPVGFILANCINMLLRILHSILFIRRKYEVTSLNPLSCFLPTLKFVLSLIGAAWVTKYSETMYGRQNILAHIIVGSICFTMVCGVWCMENRQLLMLGYNHYVRKKKIQ